MQYSVRAMCFCAMILSAACVVAQSPPHVLEGTTPVELPDAPQPQTLLAELQPGQSGSQSQNGTAQPPEQSGDQSQHDKAAQQIKKQEQQRAFGIIPSFNTSFTKDVAPLSKGQKMQLAFRSSIDPFTFAQALLIGGYRELGDNYYGYGWGAQGYGKRAGAA